MDIPKSQILSRRVAKIVVKYRELTGLGPKFLAIVNVYILQKIGANFVCFGLAFCRFSDYC